MMCPASLLTPRMTLEFQLGEDSVVMNGSTLAIDHGKYCRAMMS